MLLTKNNKYCFLFKYNNFLSNINSLYNFLNFFYLGYRFGLYCYLSWLKLGCKTYNWKKYFSIYFLLDFVFSPLQWINSFDISFVFSKLYILKGRKNHFTITKSPLVYKKKSREQYLLKQNYFFIKQKFKYLINEESCLNFLKFKKFFFLFQFLNFSINLFNYWIKNFFESFYFIETNLFYLQRLTVKINFFDHIFFFL